MQIILTALLSLFVCTQAFAGYKQTYNSQSGLPDFVGVQASSDIGIVCASGQTLTTTGSGAWACGASGGGSSSVSTVVSAGNYTLTTSNDVVVINSVSAPYTATLPTAVGATKIYTIKRSGANDVTVATTGGQKIDGDSTQILARNNVSIDVASDNANWRIK